VTVDLVWCVYAQEQDKSTWLRSSVVHVCVLYKFVCLVLCVCVFVGNGPIVDYSPQLEHAKRSNRSPELLPPRVGGQRDVARAQR